jgi:hypothetical protein
VRPPRLRSKEEHYEVCPSLYRAMYRAMARAMHRLTEPIARDGIEL